MPWRRSGTTARLVRSSSDFHSYPAVIIYAFRGRFYVSITVADDMLPVESINFRRCSRAMQESDDYLSSEGWYLC